LIKHFAKKRRKIQFCGVFLLAYQKFLSYNEKTTIKSI